MLRESGARGASSKRRVQSDNVDDDGDYGCDDDDADDEDGDDGGDDDDDSYVSPRDIPLRKYT